MGASTTHATAPTRPAQQRTTTYPSIDAVQPTLSETELSESRVARKSPWLAGRVVAAKNFSC
jgi:hypothetical protein